MSFGRASVLAAPLLSALALSAVGCGSIEYGDDVAREPARPTRPATSGSAGYVVVQPSRPAPPPPGQHVVVVPAPRRPAPPPAPVPPVPPRQAQPSGVVVCSGDQHLVIADRVIDGRRGAAIVASGNCVLEVRESVIRGRPAVHVSGNARVALVECRVRGDLMSGGAAQIRTHGTAHRGRILHGAF